MSLMIDKTIY